MEKADKFIENIKVRKLKPKPKWRFTLPNLSMWVLMLSSIIAGAMAFSIILYAVQQIEFNLIAHMSHSKFEWWLGLLPFVWIISLIIFTAISVFGLRYTRKGYKYSIKALIAINVTFSILFGTLFFISGGANWLENAFADNVRGYESIQAKKMKMWSIPEEGYLAGYLHEISDTTLQLLDFEEKVWTVDIRDSKISQMVGLEKDELIKLLGEQTSYNTFRADEIRPWGGFRQGGRHVSD